MKRFLRLSIYVLILGGLLISIKVKADTWDKPKVMIYYSENKEFKLIVTPKRIYDEYYYYNFYRGKNRPPTKQDTISFFCTAELYKINEGDSVLIWKRSLLNNDCPIYAIVANDGSSIATFDNWFSVGYGVNVFVVYDEKGNAKKTYKLEEISPFPLNDYSKSITSLYWRRDARYIDNKRIMILFVTSDDNVIKRIYNMNRLEFE